MHQAKCGIAVARCLTLLTTQEQHAHNDIPPLRLAWMMWGLGAVFFVINFYQRVAPGVMTVELMANFGLSAAALGKGSEP